LAEQTIAHTHWRCESGANTKHRANGFQRSGLASRLVRAVLPWRMPEAARRCFA